MTLLSLSGSLLFNLSPCFSVFFFFLHPRPTLVLLSITSAFLALVSCLVVAGVWALLPLNRSTWEVQVGLLTLSVLVQSLSRYILWRLNNSKYISTALIAENPYSKLHLYFSGLACGYGYGVFMLLLFQIPAWTESATFLDSPHPSCPGVSSLLVSNIQLFFFFWHHLFWSILWFQLLKNWKTLNFIFLFMSQMLVVHSSLSHSAHCAIPLSISSIILLINFGLAYRWLCVLNAKTD
ncbi:hypothetical protein HMI54_007379 [Coelomomyces lativittatus]|nr:hypothetical protein HMI55_006677 [Coelomomyces lativittatus]KAJ1512068.1 hypothetical protein HMI56_004559 [Coelomomyces lativittatus]KAJ1517016.1 hypothetical protein HMI54_007379 [Coelomomyces lativittatus]